MDYLNNSPCFALYHNQTFSQTKLLKKGVRMTSKKEMEKEKSRLVRPFFQIICIVVTMVTISLAISKRFGFSRIHDPYDTPETITPQKIKEFGGYPNRVTVGLNIDQFHKFSMSKNEFVFSGTLWFLMNPGSISLNTLDNFEFSRGEILYKSKPNTRMVDNKLLVEYKIRVQFTSPLTYRSFPVGDHRLNLTLTHQSLSLGEIIFESTEKHFINATNMRERGWMAINKTVDAGYKTTKLEDSPTGMLYRPTVTFSIDYSRKDVRYLISIFIPLLLMFFIGLFSFSTSRSVAIRITNGVIAATLAYRFVIENMAPSVGYFMLTDYLFLLFLFLNFLTFLVIMTDSFAIHISRRAKMIFIVTLHAIVIATCIYLFLVWS